MLLSDRAKSALVKALCDEPSRRILFSIIDSSLSIEEISARQDIPTTTCYRRVHLLEAEGIVRKTKTIVTDGGKKHSLYTTIIKSIKMDLDSGKCNIDIEFSGTAREIDKVSLASSQLWSLSTSETRTREPLLVGQSSST